MLEGDGEVVERADETHQRAVRVPVMQRRVGRREREVRQVPVGRQLAGEQRRCTRITSRHQSTGSPPL